MGKISANREKKKESIRKLARQKPRVELGATKKKTGQIGGAQT